MEQLRIVAPGIVGFHHVRLPVTDVFRSRDWYIETLGFRPMLVEETADGVLGVVLRHGCGAVIGLHQDAVRARSVGLLGHRARRGRPQAVGRVPGDAESPAGAE